MIPWLIAILSPENLLNSLMANIQYQMVTNKVLFDRCREILNMLSRGFVTRWISCMNLFDQKNDFENRFDKNTHNFAREKILAEF